eukprot:TRINITY_DN2342_c0_g1_i1.p1 TRINITY_DN2342_c0_g1~~TRINITY_DN2342_c0_g1_i1.p1  ORF type:complete len:499 (+),score=132.95 TRINITY_DN2342_c0_g1_i1:34-1530(+)
MTHLHETDTQKIRDSTTAQLWSSRNGENWVDEGLGTITLIDQLKTPFLKLVDDQRKILFSVEITKTFAYQQTRDNFYTFGDQALLYGLSFSRSDEAKRFHESILSSIGSIPTTPQSRPRSHTTDNAVPSPKSRREQFKSLPRRFSRIKDIFRHKEEEETPAKEMEISGPTNFQHNSGIGWTQEGGFNIHNIPPEWRKVFQSAGIRKSELKDKETAEYLMNIIQTQTAAAAANPTASEARRPVPQIPQRPSPQQVDTGMMADPAPPSPVNRTHKEPTGTNRVPPPIPDRQSNRAPIPNRPPPRRGPINQAGRGMPAKNASRPLPMPQKTTVAPSSNANPPLPPRSNGRALPSSNSGRSLPIPKKTMPPAIPAKSDSKSDLTSNLTPSDFPAVPPSVSIPPPIPAKTYETSAPPPPPAIPPRDTVSSNPKSAIVPPSSDGRINLLADIRKGSTLRHLDASEKVAPPPDGLAAYLAKAMDLRRPSLAEASSDVDDDWSDDE